MRLEWSIYALADRDGVFDYIQANSPRAAVAVRVLRVLHGSQQWPDDLPD